MARVAHVPLGVYVQGRSIVHRTPPALKLLFLIVFIVSTTLLVKTIPWALATLTLPAILYVIAKIPPRIAASQLIPPLFILIPLGLFQWWARDGVTAGVMVLTIFAALMAATVLTLTTTVGAMMDSLDQALAPLGKLGVPVESISLAMSLTIRLIPLMLTTVYEVLDARKARGAGWSIAAFGTPVIIRSIRRARAMGEALAARGAGD